MTINKKQLEESKQVMDVQIMHTGPTMLVMQVYNHCQHAVMDHRKDCNQQLVHANSFLHSWGKLPLPSPQMVVEWKLHITWSSQTCTALFLNAQAT